MLPDGGRQFLALSCSASCLRSCIGWWATNQQIEINVSARAAVRQPLLHHSLETGGSRRFPRRRRQGNSARSPTRLPPQPGGALAGGRGLGPAHKAPKRDTHQLSPFPLLPKPPP